MNSGSVMKAALSSLVLAGIVPACVSGAADVATAGVPVVLQPGPGEREAFTFSARGVQIYECKSGQGGSLAWTFVAPEADLYDASGSNIGRHGAGPFWQHHDGSEVIGTLKQRVNAPQPAAIPWLLLSTKSSGGPGLMAAVTSVQRIHTQGGLAPPQGCHESGDVGSQARVPYTADYVFFVAR